MEMERAVEELGGQYSELRVMETKREGPQEKEMEADTKGREGPLDLARWILQETFGKWGPAVVALGQLS